MKRTYFVPVTFTIEAESETAASEKVAQYLDDAARCVIDSYGMLAVYVEDKKVTPYVEEGEEA